MNPLKLMSASFFARPLAEAPSLTHQSKYRPDIDGLRAIAVLSVLFFHCSVPGFSGGFVGVDVFFVISGYLITGHLAEDMRLERFSILRFYTARIRRIAPALFVTLIVTWIAALLLFLPSYLVRASHGLMAAAASVSNIYFWKSESYFGSDAIFQPYLHTWSLSVEEQFYAVVPVAMLIAARLRFRRWAVLFGAVCLVSFALSLYATTHARSANFYLSPTRAWEMGIGSLLATARLPALTRSWLAELAAVAGMVLVAVPVFVFDSATPFPGLNALYPCLGAALLIYAGSMGGARTTRLLGTAPFVFMGKISYSLYLVHWPVIVFVRYSTVETLSPLDIAEVIAGSIVLATLSWRFVETPFRRPSPVMTQRRLLGGGLAALAVACLVGYAGVRADGFPERFPAFQETAEPDAEWKEGSCFLLDANFHHWSAQDCTRIATGPHRILFWGDSFAAQYIPGIVANADSIKATILQYTAAGCVPVLGLNNFSHTECNAFNENALNIIREQKIDTVLLAGRWTEMAPSALDQIRQTLNTVKALGVRVIMMGQSPEFVQDVHVIAFFKGDKAPDALNSWNIFFSPSLNTRLAAIARGVTFIDPVTELCKGTRCTYQDRGLFLYTDFGHMSVEGSRRAARAMFATDDVLTR